jgi:hypothetical protein
VHVVSGVGYYGGKRQLTDFWSSIEPADQVGRDIALRGIGCGTKIAQFQNGFLFIHLDRDNDKPELGWNEGGVSYQDVVRFDVCVHDVALLQEIQRKEKLFGVYPDSPNVQTNVLAKSFNDVSKIHAVTPAVKVASRARGVAKTYLRDSKTRQRCPRCSNVRSSRTTCFLSSGSAWLSLFNICTSLRPALYLKRAIRGELMRVKKEIYMDSWHRMILIATSLPTSAGSPPITLARTTLANIPLPREEKT